MKSIVTLFISALIVSCTDGKPSESFVERSFKSKHETKFKDFVEVIDFEKTNGAEYEIFGRKGYEADFKAKIKYIKSCWTGGYVDGLVRCQAGKPKPRKSIWYSNTNYRKIKVGSIKEITGRITFEKTDKGWKAPDGVIY